LSGEICVRLCSHLKKAVCTDIPRRPFRQISQVLHRPLRFTTCEALERTTFR
jgi:hypothetical protein